MFRSSVLAASCSSRVLWRRPHFLWRWRLPPALMAILIPFRGLVASCSSCFLWRCPHSLRRWRPIGCACWGKEKGWRFLWLLGALVLHVSPSATALVVYIPTFGCLRRHICARAYLLLFLCPWVLVVRVFCGGGAPSGGVWFPPFGYLRVSVIPCFFPPCERPRV